MSLLNRFGHIQQNSHEEVKKMSEDKSTCNYQHKKTTHNITSANTRGQDDGTDSDE